jgi:hypothetical protein
VLNNETLEPLLNTEKLLSLQGITQVGRYLIIADYVKGLFSYDLASGALEQINNSTRLSLKGMDGLYQHEDYLIAVQNGVQPHRVIKITLNDALSDVLSCEYLEKAHPSFGEPTLGYTNDHQFYFVANSFWTNNNKGIIAETSTELPAILRLDLAE